MGMIKKLIENSRNKNSLLKEAQMNDSINRKIQERNLGHNERILNKFVEEQRQEEIKKQLRIIGTRKNIEERRNARRMMQFNSDMFQSRNNILNWNH